MTNALFLKWVLSLPIVLSFSLPPDPPPPNKVLLVKFLSLFLLALQPEGSKEGENQMH